MEKIDVDDILTVVWIEGPIPGKLGSVEIGFKSGETRRYEGEELSWVVPQVKDRFPSSRTGLLSDLS